jgi:hypothetical protein
MRFSLLDGNGGRCGLAKNLGGGKAGRSTPAQ